MTGHDCEQQCGNPATVYAGLPYAGDWAGYFCDDCATKLRMHVWNRYDRKDGER